jgi:hypothetical protein
MDGLELNVCQTNTRQRRQSILGVKIFFEIAE